MERTNCLFFISLNGIIFKCPFMYFHFRPRNVFAQLGREMPRGFLFKLRTYQYIVEKWLSQATAGVYGRGDVLYDILQDLQMNRTRAYPSKKPDDHCGHWKWTLFLT
jgi:hypothetical protein